MARNRGHIGAQIYQCLAHAVPGIACFYNLCATDFIFNKRLDRLFFFIAVIYLSINFTITKLTGNITYWFLAWKDPTVSVVAVILSCGGPMVFCHLLAHLTQFMK